MTVYHIYIGYQHRKELRGILDAHGGGGPDYAAVERLYRFEGTRADVELCARLFESVGEGANAAELRRGCFGPDTDA